MGTSQGAVREEGKGRLGSDWQEGGGDGDPGIGVERG